MTTSIVFLLCVIAIAIGWLLGKFSLKNLIQRYRQRGWQSAYLQVMQVLLHDQSDQAIEDFVQNWSVTPKSMELHNILATMLRRKGEVDRAIRIRTQIVECNKLSQTQLIEASIELAKDYIDAGLLDRAERLLINLINHEVCRDERILQLLQNIYQTENEWEKAITIAEQLLPKHSVKLTSDKSIEGRQTIEIAQYFCEIAEVALKEQRFHDAEKALKDALNFDKRCARASLMQARLALGRGNQALALQHIQTIEQQDSHLLPECIEILKRCYINEQDCLAHLQQWQSNYPSASIELAIYDGMQHINPEQARQQYFSAVEKRPTLVGIRELAKIQSQQSSEQPIKQQSHLLFNLVDNVIKTKPLYQCKKCGFAGMQLHWLCPQCHQWDSIRRRRGSEGD